MKLRSLAGILAITAPLILTACSSLPNSLPLPKPSYNSLSGREGSDGPVLVVKIDDTAAAHPQIGLEEADVVYVEQVEAGLTRLAAVFSSELPPVIGPVRSARISDIDIFAQYGRVAFAYSGAQSKMLPIISAANWIDLGAQHEPPSIFSRDLNRSAPVNMVLDPAALLKRAADRGNVPVTSKSVGWIFGSLPKGGQTLSSVEVKWPSSRYNITSDGKGLTLSQDGHPEVSASGVSYTPSTIVIQLVTIRPSEFKDRHGGVTPKSEVVGTGKALVLRNGQVFDVTWTRARATAPTTWTLPDGSPMAFARGQVWVMLADNTRPPAVVLAPPSK